MRILVTGTAGFIGAAVAKELLERGDEVVGVDNVNDYYDTTLKEDRLKRIEPYPAFDFHRIDILNKGKLDTLFHEFEPERVIHLAAQAGVRYSLENPNAYIQSNIVGFANILEACRACKVEHLTYASSSSVYGANKTMPFAVEHNVDHPLSLYAASKKSNELMAHTYSHLYQLPTTGLRFFTVYGPWGRPDMALFLFTKKMLAGEPIQVFNHGNHRRDFTYIDDIVSGVIRTSDRIAEPNPEWSGAKPDPSSSAAPYRIYNIGNHTPVELMDFIQALETALGVTAKKEMLPMAPGDVPDTFADVTALELDVGFSPKTDIKAGIEKFVAWYRRYYNV